MTGDEAYQRRLALSSGLSQPAPSVAAVSRDLSGDDAYARRLAMSSGQLLKDGAGDDAYQRKVTTSPPSQVHQPPSEPPSLAYNPFAPISVPPPPTGPPPSVEDEVARKKEAAAAIAAKFSALAAVQPPEELSPGPQNPTQRYCPLFSQYSGIQRPLGPTHPLSLRE